MATRMQQRRGTTAQWASTNPILAAGEIGFESDSGKFKIGDGVNHWADLTYFASAAEIANLIDGAPDLLNTLNELAAAVGDDPTFFTTVATNLHNHEIDTTNVHGIANTADLATKSYADGKASDAQTAAISAASSALSAHESDTTNIHGIADTSALATKTYADGKASDAQSAAETTAASALATHSSDTSNVHGIADTLLLVTTTGTETLTNKTIENPELTVGSSIFLTPYIAVTDTGLSQSGSTFKINVSLASSLGTDSSFTGVTGVKIEDTGNSSIDGNIFPFTSLAGSYAQFDVGSIDLGGFTVFGFIQAAGGKLTLVSGSSVTISSTEIGYLDGVTSNIQTQLNSKLSSTDIIDGGGVI